MGGSCMGSYLNPGSKGFQESLNSEIYVDKSGLIEKTNAVINTRQKFICVSRPRRFGKSMAADMLAAYYDRGEDTASLFDPLKISKTGSYQQHRNQYDVLKVNMQEFLSMTHSMDEMLTMLQKYLVFDLTDHFQEVRFRDENNLIQVMKDIYAKTKRSFVILIDEWDCLFREYQQDQDAQKKYLDFLRAWLKDKDYVALAYMTGILPIKKYGSHSALNMFTEYSMTDPGDLAEYFGFTEQEVAALCDKYQMNFEEARAWYDGYDLIAHRQSGDVHYSMYSPKSVVEAMLRHKFGTYWNQTETYEALKIYIQMDMDGLQDSVVRMLAGERVKVNTGTFSNDMTTFSCKDDVLTLLIHLGYLAYDRTFRTAFIPNEEIRQELILATKRKKWNELIVFQKESEQLLKDTIQMNGNAVAKEIEKIHREYTSVIQYNNENSLSSVLSIAYLSSMQYYFKPIREFPAGRGFADFVFIPKPEFQNYYPALVVELKWDKSVRAALDQIRDRKYPESVACYAGELLLVGINYNEKTKEHECRIEKYEK